MKELYESGFVNKIFRLDGRVALIFGGHGELAKAMASALADQGCSIALAARSQEECEILGAYIRSYFGVEVIALQCDVANEESVRDAVDRTVLTFGGINILLNNAATAWSGKPDEISLSGWNKVLAVNLTGSFLTCRQVAPHMRRRGGGSMINISSSGGFMSYPPDVASIVPYTTSKAAINHLTRDLAAQWAGDQIRVNAIAPGPIASGITLTSSESSQKMFRERILLGRFGRPVEIAGMSVYLASEASSFVTGQTFRVDGGHTIR